MGAFLRAKWGPCRPRLPRPGAPGVQAGHPSPRLWLGLDAQEGRGKECGALAPRARLIRRAPSLLPLSLSLFTLSPFRLPLQAAPILIVLGAGAGLWYAKENGMLGDFVGVPGPVSFEGESERGERGKTRCFTALASRARLSPSGATSGRHSIRGGSVRRRGAPELGKGEKRSLSQGPRECVRPPPLSSFRSRALPSLSLNLITPSLFSPSLCPPSQVLHHPGLRRRPGRHRRPPGRG